jgi:hypothetical protein
LLTFTFLPKKVVNSAVVDDSRNDDPTNENSFQTDRNKEFRDQCLLIEGSSEAKAVILHGIAEADGLTSGNVHIMAKILDV